jgi:hypothetical protein
MEQLTQEERSAVLRALRGERVALGHRIEMHKSQRRRGTAGAAAEVTAMERELDLLCSAIRKLWISEEL